MRTNQKSNVGPAAQEHPAVVATKCPRTNYQKPHDRLPRCFAENSRMDDRLSLRSRSIRRRSSDRDPNSIVETADATRETNLAITVTQLLRRNAPHRARSLEGQEFACRAPHRHGRSTSHSRRNRCNAAKGEFVPKAVVDRCSPPHI